MRLIQRYIDKTGDIQSAAYISCYIMTFMRITKISDE